LSIFFQFYNFEDMNNQLIMQQQNWLITTILNFQNCNYTQRLMLYQLLTDVLKIVKHTHTAPPSGYSEALKNYGYVPAIDIYHQ